MLTIFYAMISDAIKNKVSLLKNFLYQEFNFCIVFDVIKTFV